MPDYEYRELMAELLCKSEPLFFKFSNVARNIDDFPMNEKFVAELSDVHNSIPYQHRHQIEVVTEREEY